MNMIRNHVKVLIRVAGVSFLAIAAGSGCEKQIWNAGDLAGWVRSRAVEQGCQRDSIELAEWYTSEAGKNDWHGVCVKGDSGERVDFSINVDSVWTPSSDK